MRNDKTLERTQLKRLRAKYDETFRHWSVEVKHLQDLSAGSRHDAQALLEAGHRVDEAARAYRESRNALTEFMMAGQAQNGQTPSAAQASPQTGAWQAGNGDSVLDRAAQVKDVAYRLWESSGKGTGNAESDWYRAEKLLSSRG